MTKNLKFMSKINFVLIIFLLVSTISSFSQEMGSPIISNYSSSDYNSHVQNWSIIKDKRGIMYFANHSCILEFDGIYWNKISIEHGFNVRSLDIDDYGTIYVVLMYDLWTLMIMVPYT